MQDQWTAGSHTDAVISKLKITISFLLIGFAILTDGLEHMNAKEQRVASFDASPVLYY